MDLIYEMRAVGVFKAGVVVELQFVAAAVVQADLRVRIVKRICVVRSKGRDRNGQDTGSDRHFDVIHVIARFLQIEDTDLSPGSFFAWK